MSKSTEKPIFIVACPRSGTTILASILNAHSKICSATETHFFNYISKQKKYDWRNFSTKDFELFLDESRIVDFYTLSKITEEELRDKFNSLELKSSVSENKKAIFNLLIEALTEKRSKEIFCEKTPQHLLNVEEILSLYPQAKIIHLVRDGRDTVNSLLKMPWRPDGLINNSRFWKSYIKLGQKLEQKFSSDRFKTFRYEDLLKSPVDTVKEICNFIEIDFQEDMINRTASNKESSENIFSDWESSWKHKSLEEIDSTRIGAWAKELEEEDQTILNWHQRKILAELGYKANEVDLKPGLQFKVFVKYLDLIIKKVFRAVSFAIN